MPTPQDHDKALLEGSGTAATLIRCKETITRLFEERVLEMLRASSQHESHPMTVDTLPAFLTNIAQALSPRDDKDFASENSNVALLHGSERAKLSTYSLAQLIKEYQILRETIVEVLSAHAKPSLAEWSIVHRSVDEAIADAASAFVQVHQGVREQFTATLTHDFRGPLSAANNYMELVMRSGDQPELRQRFASRAIENVRRVNRMIDDLLDASRARVGERLALNVSECELSALVGEVLDELASREGNRFVLEAERPIIAFCGCERIRQAIYNLAENAIKYGERDTPITTRLIEAHGRVHVSVHNFGDPIPPEEQAVLFQAYRRTRSAESSGKKGWGLGLVLVQAIAEAHGGGVLIESSADQGTTFTLDILRDVRDLHAPAQSA